MVVKFKKKGLILLPLLLSNTAMMVKVTGAGNVTAHEGALHDL